MDKKQLEQRLITFAVMIFAQVDSMPDNRAANHLSGQLLRSRTSPALNYGEAQSAESRNDFIHKIKVVLKELRETHICLQIIYEAKLFTSEEKIQTLLKETNELVAIFVKTVKTAMENSKARKWWRNTDYFSNQKNR